MTPKRPTSANSDVKFVALFVLFATAVCLAFLAIFLLPPWALRTILSAEVVVGACCALTLALSVD